MIARQHDAVWQKEKVVGEKRDVNELPDGN
jgi:hypothetical protein